jgi:transmembrane sensor
MEQTDNNIAIEVLVLKYWENSLEAADKLILENWLAQSEENAKLFEDYLGVLIASSSTIDGVNLQEIQEQSWKRIETASKPSGSAAVIKLFYFALAACLLGVFIIIGLGRFGVQDIETFSFETNVLKSEEILLPDGSRVWLNNASSLRYTGTAEKRTLILEGEGFFDIKTDSSSVFEVLAGNSVTRVLGTSFNIDARDKSSVNIRVASGRVAFGDSSQDLTPINLEQGEQAVLNNQEKELLKLEDIGENVSVWQTNKLMFDKVNLNQIANELNEFASLKLTFDEAGIGACLITMEVDLEQLDLLEEVLVFSLDLEVEKVDALNWILKGAGCE